MHPEVECCVAGVEPPIRIAVAPVEPRSYTLGHPFGEQIKQLLDGEADEIGPHDAHPVTRLTSAGGWHTPQTSRPSRVRHERPR